MVIARKRYSGNTYYNTNIDVVANTFPMHSLFSYDKKGLGYNFPSEALTVHVLRAQES